MKFQIANSSLTFVTYKVSVNAEVYGWLEDMDGKIVSGSGGWWRTNDEKEAASRAAAMVLADVYGKPNSRPTSSDSIGSVCR